MNPRGAGSEPELTEPETLASIRAQQNYDRAVDAYIREWDLQQKPDKFWRQFKVILLILGLSAIIMLVGVWLL